MGVDFSSCDKCGVTFCECGPHSRCETCDQKLCERCSHSLCLWGNMKDKPTDEENYNQCPFCSGKIVSDRDLLSYLIQKSGKIREEIENEFRQDVHSA